MTKNYGLIGCGMMGCEHIRNINLLEGARVAGVYDPVRERAEEGAGLAPGASISETLSGLIERSDLDALIIASPNHLHVTHLQQIADERPLPVLCEKPLFTDAADEDHLIQLERSFGAPIWVAMEYRYMPPIAELISRSERVTGGIKMLTLREHRFPFLEKIGHWNRFNRNTGGTLVEKCCHFFDLMRLILGAEPVSVVASVGQVTNHLDEVYEGEVPDIWDGGYAIFDFDNGARAMLELCMFADGTIWNEEITAIGPRGKIECRVPGPQRFWPEHLGPSPHPQISEYPRDPKDPKTETIVLDPSLVEAGDHHGSTFYQHQKFLEVVCGRAEPEVTLQDGRRAVRMGLAAQEAVIGQCAVRLNAQKVNA